LPDGIFSYQKCQLWHILEGLGVKHFGAFNGRLIFLVPFWYLFWPFGIFVAILVIFTPLWFVAPIKIWQPW
jgi:hypothetical protein